MVFWKGKGRKVFLNDSGSIFGTEYEEKRDKIL